LQVWRFGLAVAGAIDTHANARQDIVRDLQQQPQRRLVGGLYFVDGFVATIAE
jgi:hypothetical protein